MMLSLVPDVPTTERDAWTTSQALGVHDVIQRLCAVSGAIGARAPLRREDRERCDEELVSAIAELRALITVLTDAVGSSEPQLLESVIDAEIEAQALVVPTRVSRARTVWIAPQTEELVRNFLRETLTNATKHARPSMIDVDVDVEVDVDVYGSRSQAVIKVRNDGVGDERERDGTRLGMRLLHADAKRLGATITSGCATDSGWWVALVIPAANGDSAGAHRHHADRRGMVSA
jgi:signal transduction histidine kinase